MYIFRHFSSYQLLYAYLIPLSCTTFLTRRIPLAVLQEEKKSIKFSLCIFFPSPLLIPPLFLHRTQKQILTLLTQALETNI